MQKVGEDILDNYMLAVAKIALQTLAFGKASEDHGSVIPHGICKQWGVTFIS